MGRRGYSEQLWWRHDITPTQRSALRFLARQPNGMCRPVDAVPKIRLATWRALQNLGLIEGGEISHYVVVKISQSGRDAVADQQAN